jgi:hypothetical protein
MQLAQKTEKAQLASALHDAETQIAQLKAEVIKELCSQEEVTTNLKSYFSMYQVI